MSKEIDEIYGGSTEPIKVNNAKWRYKTLQSLLMCKRRITVTPNGKLKIERLTQCNAQIKKVMDKMSDDELISVYQKHAFSTNNP